MDKFTDLEPLYNHLEDKSIDYDYPHQIGKLFQDLRDLKHQEKKYEDEQKAQWEIDFFSFTLKNGKTYPIYEGTNDKGEAVAYPTFERFSDETYNYLIARIEKTNNPIIKSRYAHILWCSPKKHADYARVAVDTYLELLKLYEAKDKEYPEKHFGMKAEKTIENAYHIANNSKYNAAQVNNELKRLVIDFNDKSSSSYASRSRLIELMLENSKGFPKDNFIGFDQICLKIAENKKSEGNIQAAIEMYELGKKIEQKLEKDVKKWDLNIAEACENLMDQSTNEKSFLALDQCQHALNKYRELKNVKKVDELEKKYIDIKKTLKFSKFGKSIDLSAHINRCREIAAKVVAKAPDEIIKILMLDKNLLPKYDDMEKEAKEKSKKFVMQSLVSKVLFDENGNPAQHFVENNEKEYYALLEQFKFELELDKIHLVNAIFFELIKNNKLSTENIVNYLRNYSWYGKSIIKTYADGTTIEYDWLNLVIPAINEYFIQMQYSFKSNERPDLVLCIDSLAVKMEGLIRDFCKVLGVSSFFMTKDNKGRNISQEKDIHALLYEERVRELFDKDDLLFFKYLLVEKAGYNLRHRVAHSLMLYQEYSVNYMHLLILAILRLGKYDFIKSSTDPNNKNN